MSTRRAALSRTRLAALLPLALAACEGTLDTGEPEASAADDFKVEEKIVGGRLETGYPAVGALLTTAGLLGASKSAALASGASLRSKYSGNRCTSASHQARPSVALVPGFTASP